MSTSYISNIKDKIYILLKLYDEIVNNMYDK